MNTEKLLSSARQGGVETEFFYFDPKMIDWEDYFINIHFPGIIKHALKWPVITYYAEAILAFIIWSLNLLYSNWCWRVYMFDILYICSEYFVLCFLVMLLMSIWLVHYELQISGTQLMTQERRKAIWAIYGMCAYPNWHATKAYPMKLVVHSFLFLLLLLLLNGLCCALVLSSHLFIHFFLYKFLFIFASNCNHD